MNSKPKGRPLVVAYGQGVDSTAMLIGLWRRNIRPELILFADTGGEKVETYRYRAVMNAFLRRHRFPEIQVVKYRVKNFKNYPPYYTLEENCLTNGTLPSLAFGFKSCSIKWKATPQDKYVEKWQPAIDCWADGKRVVKCIGFDASEERRTFSPGPDDSPLYEYAYPLQDWGWDRERCKEEIASVGLPEPPKSSCFFCPAMKPWEVKDLPADKLRRIVVMEARAKPRLEKIQGLWRNGCKGTRGAIKRPGMMTEFIRDEGLLPSDEIDRLAAEVPKEIVLNQERYAHGDAVPSWEEYFAGPSFCNAGLLEE